MKKLSDLVKILTGRKLSEKILNRLNKDGPLMELKGNIRTDIYIHGNEIVKEKRTYNKYGGLVSAGHSVDIKKWFYNLDGELTSTLKETQRFSS